MVYRTQPCVTHQCSSLSDAHTEDFSLCSHAVYPTPIDVRDRKTDRQTDRQTDRERERDLQITDHQPNDEPTDGTHTHTHTHTYTIQYMQPRKDADDDRVKQRNYLTCFMYVCSSPFPL